MATETETRMQGTGARMLLASLATGTGAMNMGTEYGPGVMVLHDGLAGWNLQGKYDFYSHDLILGVGIIALILFVIFFCGF